MQEERSHSQISGTHNSKVRAIQSTQLDLELLETQLVSSVNSTQEIGSGDVRRNKEPTSLTRKQLPLPEFSEAIAQGKYNSEEIQCTKQASSCHRVPKLELHSNERRREPFRRVKTSDGEVDVGVRPLTCASLGKLSDDTNENAATAKSKAKQNPAGSPRSKSRGRPRKFSSLSRCKQPNPQAPSRHRVIELPPNSVLKITSRSALNVQKNRQKSTVAIPESQSPPFAKKFKRSANSPEPLNSVKNVKSKQFAPLKPAPRPPSRRADTTHSSRYRVTPCPTSAPSASSNTSGWSSHHHSATPVCSSRTSGLSSTSGRMRFRSSSARLTAARSRSPSRYKQASSKRHRRASASGSAFSRRRSRSRRGRYPSENFALGVSSDLLLNQSNAARSKASLRRNARKLSKISLYRGRRRRRASSPRARKSRASVARKTSRTSSTRGQRKRGRPRGSGKRLRSSSSLGDAGRQDEAKSGGLLERVSSLFRSRSASPVQSQASSSWVSRMLPLPRSKHQRRLQRHRSKSHKYSRAPAGDAEEDCVEEGTRKRSLTSGDNAKGTKKGHGIPSGPFCTIL